MPDLSAIIAAWNSTPPPSFTYDGIVLQEATGNSFPSPYSPPQFMEDYYFLFTYSLGQPVIKFSEDGETNWISVASNFPYGSIFFDAVQGKFFAAYHEWPGDGKCYFRFAQSTNGIDFTQIAAFTQNYGEDISIIKLSTGNYRAYVRMKAPVGNQPPIRTIGYMESADFINWTTPIEILVPEAVENGKEFYSMSVIEVDGDGFYGFMNTLNPFNQQMTVRLWWSPDGIEDWVRINYNNPVLPLYHTADPTKSRKQLYANAAIVDSNVVIYTISAKFRHDEVDQGTQWYYTEKWTISLASLANYKNYLLAE